MKNESNVIVSEVSLKEIIINALDICKNDDEVKNAINTFNEIFKGETDE